MFTAVTYSPNNEGSKHTNTADRTEEHGKEYSDNNKEWEGAN